MSSAEKRTVLREFSESARRTAIFLKPTGWEKPLHATSFYGKELREVALYGKNAEYVFYFRDSDLFELYEVVYHEGVHYTNIYRVTSGSVEYLGRLGDLPEVSTGFAKLDSLVDDIVNYRAFWSSKLCRVPLVNTKLYSALLKANAALNYHLFKRFKEVLHTYSSEYLGFTLAVLHQVLISKGFNPLNEGIARVCNLAREPREPAWVNVNVHYVSSRANGIPVTISLEKRVGGVVPDVLIRTPRGNVTIESKQGPSTTWLRKAVHQASKYKSWIRGILVLITPRELSNGELEVLAKYYDFIVDKCTVVNHELCEEVLSSILEPCLSNLGS